MATYVKYNNPRGDNQTLYFHRPIDCFACVTRHITNDPKDSYSKILKIYVNDEEVYVSPNSCPADLYYEFINADQEVLWSGTVQPNGAIK